MLRPIPPRKKKVLEVLYWLDDIEFRLDDMEDEIARLKNIIQKIRDMVWELGE